MSLTDTEIEEMLADREGLEMMAALPQERMLESTLDGKRALSDAAKDLIIRYESGGKAYYERIVKARAHWPKYASGVTIGFGFDLGYNTWEQTQWAWRDELGDATDRLQPAIGLKATEPDKADKIERIKALVTALSDITVPWEMASRVFLKDTAPRYVQETARALPNDDLLSDDSFGALVSLVFNRGPSFRRSGDRYTEMRAIRSHMEQQAFTLIPDELRSMKRIWTSAGLKQRREDEAALFESGLIA